MSVGQRRHLPENGGGGNLRRLSATFCNHFVQVNMCQGKPAGQTHRITSIRSLQRLPMSRAQRSKHVRRKFRKRAHSKRRNSLSRTISHGSRLAALTLPSALMTGSFPFLLDLRRAFASSRPTGSFAVTISFVITCRKLIPEHSSSPITSCTP